jgi:glucan-binding YG repeat protein
MKSGLQKIGGKYYYLGGANDGAMKTGWQKIGGKQYYFNASGARVS